MNRVAASAILICALFYSFNSTGQSEQAQLPPVYLNHANLLVNPKLYQAIKQSDFINTQFSRGGEHTVTGVNGSISHTHISLRGENTYLELNDSGSMSPEDRRRNVILFIMSVDDITQLPAVAAAFEREHIHAPIETTTRTVDRHEIKWHDNTAGSKWGGDPDPDHDPWFDVAAIYPDYLKAIHPNFDRQARTVTRAQYNSQNYNSDGLMHDITGFDLNIGRDQLPLLEAQFRAMGYALRSDGILITAIGPEIKFRLKIIKPGEPKQVAVHFSLNKNKEGQQVYSFPDSELRFNSDRTATWVFPPGADF